MIYSIELRDLDRSGQVLAHLTAPALVQKASNAMAERYTGDVLDWIAEGKAFTSRHGGAGLEGSISWHPVSGGGARVYANKDYAEYVEEGTGLTVGHQPWVIAPTGGRKALKIPGPGGYVLRRSVVHKGSRAFPFFNTDRDNRDTHMLDAAESVLWSAMAHG